MKQELKDYELLKELGQGKFGKVFKARVKGTDYFVAIKVLSKSQIQDQQDFQRIQNELTILRQVCHPHLVDTFDIQETKNFIFLVMEYLPGGELFDEIVKQKFFSQEHSGKIFVQLLKGVQSLHKNNLVHRDLKPENILLDESKKIVKIADFGLGRDYDPKELLTTACGSPCYAPPEMFSGEHYDPEKVDVWALGVVLYAMLVGFLPFDDQDSTKILTNMMNYRIEFPEMLSSDLVDLLRKMIHVNPMQRISLSEIETHPWVQKIQRNQNGGHCCLVEECDSGEEEIDFKSIQELKQQFPTKDILQIVKQKLYSPQYCLYKLFKKQQERQTEQFDFDTFRGLIDLNYFYPSSATQLRHHLEYELVSKKGVWEKYFRMQMMREKGVFIMNSLD